MGQVGATPRRLCSIPEVTEACALPQGPLAQPGPRQAGEAACLRPIKTDLTTILCPPLPLASFLLPSCLETLCLQLPMVPHTLPAYAALSPLETPTTLAQKTLSLGHLPWLPSSLSVCPRVLTAGTADSHHPLCLAGNSLGKTAHYVPTQQ